MRTLASGRRTYALALALIGLGALLGATSDLASARSRAPVPHLSSVRCWPSKACGYRPHVVSPGGTLRFKGRNLRPRMMVLFARRSKVKIGVVVRLRRKNGFRATVPASAKSGRVRVVARNGRRSNAAGPITIKAKPVAKPPPAKRPPASGSVLDGTGMWIWYVSRSSGGTPAGIGAAAKRYGVRTVFVKSSDGSNWWPQFSPELVTALKANGLRVCAWQYVYGAQPSTEAALGARAAETGADCLVIDAESQYEGKYSQAQTYVSALRTKLGASYPVALSGFPYVDFHPAFPYSVFLGPGGAQYNIPQIYWKAIGTTVDRAFAHTYGWNQVYGRPIFPLGQLYDGPPASEIRRFRELAAAYGSPGLSWWSWQSASANGWSEIGNPLLLLTLPAPAITYPTLKPGSRGDAVVWAQQHLMSAGQPIDASGVYTSTTGLAVKNFQAANGLLTTGQVDSLTWPALLRYKPASVAWNKTARASRLVRSLRNGPRSAPLRALRNELSNKPAP